MAAPGVPGAAERPAPVGGALYMVASGTAFTAMLGTIRPVAAELHALEMAFFRNLLALVLMAPWLLLAGARGLKTTKLRLIALRAALGFVSTVCWFLAVPHLPLADAVALNFTAPLFATVFAATVLREDVRWRRWSATLVGFAGALVVLRPGFAELAWPALVLVVSAAAWGSQHIVLKVLSRTEPVTLIVTYHSILLTPATFVLALFVWSTPSLAALGWLFAMSALGTLGHVLLTRAFASADASVVLPFDYAKLPVGALIGYLAYGERPEAWTWIGAAVILGASVYVARRESRLARAREASPPP